MRSLRGLVLGWYHQRNAGDDRLQSIIKMWLHDHELTFMNHTHVPSRELLKGYDYVLIGGGSVANAVYGVFKDMHKWALPAKIPLFCAGIGVSEHAEFHKEFSVIKQTNGHIWVRDKYSAINTMQPKADVDIAPDMSWMFPVSYDLGARNGIAVNLCSFNESDKLQPAWAEQLRGLDNALPWPLSFGKQNDRKILSEVFNYNFDICEFDPTIPSRVNFVVAMRYHAIIFSIQAGTPFIALQKTKKVAYLLEEIGFEGMLITMDSGKNIDQEIKEIRAKVQTELLLDKSSDMRKITYKYAMEFKNRIEQSAYHQIKSNSKHKSISSSVIRKLFGP